ncbi:uncharacterized protein RHOBADRAFT_55422 [Rhodotorula graminis WP1]|uniref:RRM domain-containing protein n=1 Tax=Rhodotorula graminis (strain WP1) TaxID=578459 RepID=A0A0N8PZM3_RHOGW|nr:uncharacterized protein RHOBADRAFT_55422 [Rhodotorula graminis WP1]KPV72725.1 hypothetical protein RHOBADRAFT_55422 [Rhodotorula graminis WP1]
MNGHQALFGVLLSPPATTPCLERSYFFLFAKRFNNGPVPHVVEDVDKDIIDTAIVIKNIPFACPKEQLLNIMSSLALPAPFAFNYHYAPEDPTSFRGLAFANYRDGHEAGVVRAAMDGLEIMGRKLRCEFKKQLRPGEKEAIERTKALKRMRSAQLLAGGSGGGGAPDFGWNRREASAPGGHAGGGMVTGASGGGGGGGAGGNAGLGVSAGEDGIEDYGRPLAFGQGTHLGGGLSHPSIRATRRRSSRTILLQRDLRRRRRGALVVATKPGTAPGHDSRRCA